MSLIPFHRVLISSAIAFCAGFGGWQLLAYLRAGRLSMLLIALLSLAAAIALALYLRRLRRFLGLPTGTPTRRSGAS